MDVHPVVLLQVANGDIMRRRCLIDRVWFEFWFRQFVLRRLFGLLHFDNRLSAVSRRIKFFNLLSSPLVFFFIGDYVFRSPVCHVRVPNRRMIIDRVMFIVHAYGIVVALLGRLFLRLVLLYLLL